MPDAFFEKLFGDSEPGDGKILAVTGHGSSRSIFPEVISVMAFGMA
jgi:hypothetical protein